MHKFRNPLKEGGGGEGGGGEGEGGETAGEKLFGAVPELILSVLLMAIFVLFETFQEHKRIRFGHAAALITILGIISSIIVHWANDSFLEPFSEVALFDYAIPFILFNDGYNMRK